MCYQYETAFAIPIICTISTITNIAAYNLASRVISKKFEIFFLQFIILFSRRLNNVIASEAKQSLSLAGLRLPRPLSAGSQ
jgi:hypothetical protein